MKNIAIIDDHKLFSSGLARLFSDLGSNYSIDTFSCITQLHNEGKDSYALLVLDFYVPGSNFSENFSTLKQAHPSTPIVVISASPSPADRSEALASGASLFLNKNRDPDEMIELITAVLRGEKPNTPAADQPELINAFQKFSLTARQIDILILVAKGYSNKEIARTYEISPETVKSHLKAIFRRIKVENRIEAVDLVRQYGAM